MPPFHRSEFASINFDASPSLTSNCGRKVRNFFFFNDINQQFWCKRRCQYSCCTTAIPVRKISVGCRMVTASSQTNDFPVSFQLHTHHMCASQDVLCSVAHLWLSSRSRCWQDRRFTKQVNHKRFRYLHLQVLIQTLTTFQ